MNDAQEIAARYLAPPTDGWWQWAADGSALLWNDGKTIAFRQEVEAVLERLAPMGLPRFGAVVLLLAACRDGWRESAGRRTLGGLAGQFRRFESNVDASPNVQGCQLAFAFTAQRLDQVLARLDAIGQLPEQVRLGKLAKAVLAETVFEPGPKALSVQESSAVVRALADGIAGAALAARVAADDPLTRFAADADALRPGIESVNAESLLLRARTGFDQGPEPVTEDVEPPNADQLRKLLSELRTDAELAGLARVAENLMAATHIPRALHAREELPVGGVSDLSNRGSLDRLLVSELANDELTLAVRVALNEALYLRRESPPRDPPRQRALLLDCGIRLWGVPRAFALAAALAFAATADRKSSLAVFRATQDGVEPVTLHTRAGLVECMGALEPSPHPASALKPFLEAVTGRSDGPTRLPFDAPLVDPTPPHAGAERGGERPIGNPRTGAAPDLDAPSGPAGKTALRDPGRRGGERDRNPTLARAALPRRGGVSQRGAGPGVTEAILITHPDVLADPEFAIALSGLSVDLLFVATVDRAGHFQLFSYTGAGRRLVAEAELNLESLFAEPRRSTPLVVKPNPTTLPAIFSVEPFPLLLPCAIKPSNAIASEELGLVGVSGDGRLLQWAADGKQARQLCATLPPGRLLGLFREYAKLPVVRAVFADRRSNEVHVLRAWVEEGAAPSVGRMRFQFGGAIGCCAIGSSLCLISASAVYAFGNGSVKPVATMLLPIGINWRSDRFFKKGGDWFVLAFDGRQLKLEKVPIESGWYAMMLFDRQGVDGPWAVYRDGTIAPAGGQRISVGAPAEFKSGLQRVRVSREGHRVAAWAASRTWSIDLRDNKGWLRACEPGDWTGPLLIPQNLLSRMLAIPGMAPKRFSSVFVNRKGELSLISRRAQTWTFSYHPYRPLALTQSDSVPIGGAGHGFREFKPIEPPEGMRIKLAMAQWPDGSQAFLDSRWLLHLKSADASVPQLSIVLANGGIVGWSSDGRIFGDSLFLPDGAHAPIGAMCEILRQFVTRLR